MSASLSRLRVAFMALGVALSLTVGGLLVSALSRLEEQRMFRHRVVADRVFDEAEREISALLQHEATRPSAAYDATETDPQRWGRFIVGYYTRTPELHIVVESRLAKARVERLRAAVSETQALLDAGGRRLQWPATAPLEDEPAPTRSPDVLRQLNRGVKVRERRQHDVTRIFAVARAADGSLVLERVVNDRREGFVLSVPELVATIQSWVLSAQGLDAVGTLSVDQSALQRPRAGQETWHGYLVSHRLAAPLDDQQIFLELSQLDDEDAAGTLYSLAALLVAAAVLGLFAIYRMVAVQVTYAERRNNFVAAVTHELRTPLTAIRMYGEMLRDGMVADERVRQEYYAAITSEGERLTRLINNVMEHGQLRRGQRRAHLVRSDVSQVVQEVVDLMRPHASQEGFRIELAGVDAPLRAEVDVDALKQVLFNVIDNGIKYGRGELCRLDVSVGRAASAAIEIHVRDHGPGIDAQQREVIFQPFVRGENELTRRHKGTGLGLALAHDLIVLMRGTIRAQPAVPGLDVCVALPIAESSATLLRRPPG